MYPSSLEHDPEKMQTIRDGRSYGSGAASFRLLALDLFDVPPPRRKREKNDFIFATGMRKIIRRKVSAI
jgi:hypothetical protein